MAVARDYILAEIRRTAADNGGAPLGWRRFAAETGIREQDWLRHWPRWGDAVSEAGFAPNRMQDRHGEERLAGCLADETRRLGRFPTIRELHLRHAADPSFPDAKVFSNRWGRAEREAQTAAWCASRPEWADVLAIIGPTAEPGPDKVPTASERLSPVVVGQVYMLRMGRHFKVGRSNSAGRREYELAIQLPERAEMVHVIQTDDPVGIEAYWHHRFRDRRRNGEWFALTADDVAAFRRRKFM